MTDTGPTAPRSLHVRPATEDDAALLLAWRNDPEVRGWSRSSDEISQEAHGAWLRTVLADPDRHLLVVETTTHDAVVATTRYDRLNERPDSQDRSRWEVSITVAPGMRGQGIGSATLRASDAWLRRVEPAATEVVAHVRPANTGSRYLFERNGYRPARSDEAGMDCLIRFLDER